MATQALETSAAGVYGYGSEPANETSAAEAPADEANAFNGWSCAKERRPDRPLSPRERQILTLIIDGKTRKEVAYDLAIAHSTVRVLYSRAMKKLGGHWQPARRRP